jgi:hypothetical protein
VSPLRGTKLFHVKGKLTPQYIEPYLIVQRIGNVAYKLELPPELAAHALDVQDTLEYLEYPVRILDWAEKSTRNTTTRFCKVLWSNHSEREATWEKLFVMREKYPHLFEPEVTS